MEGLTAFVSRFDEEKQEKHPRQSTPTTEQSQAGNMPSTGSSAARRSLPFSIEEILSDKRHSITDRQQSIPREDVQKNLNDYSLQGKKTWTFVEPKVAKLIEMKPIFFRGEISVSIPLADCNDVIL